MWPVMSQCILIYQVVQNNIWQWIDLECANRSIFALPDFSKIWNPTSGWKWQSPRSMCCLDSDANHGRAYWMSFCARWECYLTMCYPCDWWIWPSCLFAPARIWGLDIPLSIMIGWLVLSRSLASHEWIVQPAVVLRSLFYKFQDRAL